MAGTQVPQGLWLFSHQEPRASLDSTHHVAQQDRACEQPTVDCMPRGVCLTGPALCSAQGFTARSAADPSSCRTGESGG